MTNRDEMTADDLKPCPFCGYARIVVTDCSHGVVGRVFFARCPGCAAEGPWGKSAGMARHLWNSRPGAKADADEEGPHGES